jgi:CDP-glucose 4,6-dehydratase
MLELGLFDGCYAGRRVLVTGHTGFKGSWLTLWLRSMGATVKGIALLPEDRPSHWQQLGLRIQQDVIDIRSFHELRMSVQSFNPEIIFHLAAQALVRDSYQDPLATWTTNVLGTAHVLEACRGSAKLSAVVVVTTDKCYENNNWVWGYRETDALGGHDPYSASKASVELVVKSYRKSFYENEGVTLIATARAGNVIGGGDWSKDRLIPDLVRAIERNESLEIRSPKATRPWQHVLDCLSGYLVLGQHLLSGDADAADAWNFGPDPSSNQTVEEVLELLRVYWPEARWNNTSGGNPYEAALLFLDSSKATRRLRWRPVWDLQASVMLTARWYQNFTRYSVLDSLKQLHQYVTEARKINVHWAQS